MKHILIDLGHLSHRMLFGQVNQIKQAGFGLLRHMLIKNILSSINKFEPDRVYIGVDFKKSWRKEETLTYKANRVEVRKKTETTVDWVGFYSFMEEFASELKDNFPFHTIAYPTLEADDVIGYLVKALPKEDEKICITSDTDYIQLLRYDNTKLYCPIKTKYIKSPNPLHDLELKIVCGDKSDNIPGIRFRLGKKTAEKLIESGELYKMLNEIDKEGNPCELMRNYQRNKKLIDLTFTPEHLCKELHSVITNYTPVSGSSIFGYFVKHSLRDLIVDITKYRNYLSNLKKDPVQLIL